MARRAGRPERCGGGSGLRYELDDAFVHPSAPVNAMLEQCGSACARNLTRTVAKNEIGGCRARVIDETEECVQTQARAATRSGRLAAKWRSYCAHGA